MSQPAPPLDAMPFVRRLEWSLDPTDEWRGDKVLNSPKGERR